MYFIQLTIAAHWSVLIGGTYFGYCVGITLKFHFKNATCCHHMLLPPSECWCHPMVLCWTGNESLGFGYDFEMFSRKLYET